MWFTSNSSFKIFVLHVPTSITRSLPFSDACCGTVASLAVIIIVTFLLIWFLMRRIRIRRTCAQETSDIPPIIKLLESPREKPTISTVEYEIYGIPDSRIYAAQQWIRTTALQGGYLEHPGTTRLTIFALEGSVYGCIEGADGRVSNILRPLHYDLNWDHLCPRMASKSA
ncbi:hypothetical protein FRB91_002826 [Serendipita sp. 411]|nr:hypothetical protein FRB91_002826 [Serendipita sp. 411]